MCFGLYIRNIQVIEHLACCILLGFNEQSMFIWFETDLLYILGRFREVKQVVD